MVLPVVLVAPTGACGGSERLAGGGDSPSASARDIIPTPTAVPAEPSDVPVPAGEIWQWALGRSIWDDPAMAELASTMGPSSDSITMQPFGFQLDVDASGVVSAVLLFNDETALGFPASESSFSAYPGALPADLSWSDTYESVVGRYGEGMLVTGGNGIEFTFAYVTSDGWETDLTYLAKHGDELPGSPLHIVTVRSPSQ